MRPSGSATYAYQYFYSVAGALALLLYLANSDGCSVAIFEVAVAHLWKQPNILSQFGHDVQNGRVVNTVSTSFNTIARQTTEKSQRKKQVFALFC